MLIFLSIVIFLVVFIAVETEMVGEWMESFLLWVEESGFLGVLVFVLVYIMATVCFVPGLILTLGAGFIFTRVYGTGLGIFIATSAVFIGASIGATIAFLLGRYVFRESLQEKIQRYPKFMAVEEAFQEEGLKLVLLLRLSPLIPFNLFNYFMGVTSVKMLHYVIGHVGMLPGTLAYVYFGSALGSISEAASGEFEGGDIQLGLLIGGTVLAFAAVFYVSYVAKKKINKILDKQKELESPEEGNENDQNEENATLQDQAIPEQVS
jgi:uncharacterized membrane protein YdjX (TVP38/TMEM64 family)